MKPTTAGTSGATANGIPAYQLCAQDNWGNRNGGEPTG